MKPDSSQRIVLVGAGRLAAALLRTIPERIVAVIARNPGAREEIRGLAPDIAVLPSLRDLGATPFDLLWILTPDRAIADVASEAADALEGWDGRIVLHSSGGTPLAALEPLRERGAYTMALHPNASITGAQPIARSLRWGVTPDDERATRIARALLDGLEPRLIGVADERRALYHAAASTAANYSVALFTMAAELYRRAGFSEEDARGIVAEFMRESVERAATLPAGEAITGPIVRGDVETVRAQLAAIDRDAPEFGEAARALVRLTAILFRTEEGERWLHP